MSKNGRSFVSRYMLVGEANGSYEFDPVDHVLSVQGRNIANGRLGDEFAFLAAMRDGVQSGDIPASRDAMRRHIEHARSGLQRYHDTLVIARTDNLNLDGDADFLVGSLGVSGVAGFGDIQSIILERTTIFMPDRHMGADTLHVACTAKNLLDESFRRDYLIFRVRDLLTASSQLDTHHEFGYTVWRGDMQTESVRCDVNDPSAMSDMSHVLDVVTFAAREIEFGSLHLDDFGAGS